MTGNRRNSVDDAGWEFLFFAVDNHAQLTFTAMHSDEGNGRAVQCLQQVLMYDAWLGVSIKRLLAEDGSAFRFKLFSASCEPLHIQQKFKRA